MLHTYKELGLWRNSKEVSLLVVRFSRKLPNERVVWIITDQLLRAIFSVGANIAEGFGKYQGKEYLRFLSISIGSVQEAEYWLGLLKDIFPQFFSEIEMILSKNEETIKMLIKTVSTIKGKNRLKQ